MQPIRVELDELPGGKVKLMIRTHSDEQTNLVEKLTNRVMDPSTDNERKPCHRLRYFAMPLSEAEVLVAKLPGADVVRKPFKEDSNVRIPFQVLLSLEDHSALQLALAHAGWHQDSTDLVRQFVVIVNHYLSGAKYLPPPKGRTLDGPTVERLLERIRRFKQGQGGVRMPADAGGEPGSGNS